MESRGRLIQAKLAAPLLAARGFRALGFVRLGDYTRERLGISPRTIEEDARVAVALDDLPKLAAAFLAGAITWTHLRLLTGIATSTDEAQWLRHALSMTTRDLEALVHLRRVQMRAPSAGRETDTRGPIDAKPPSDESRAAKTPNGESIDPLRAENQPSEVGNTTRSEGNAPPSADPASPRQHEGRRHARPEGNAPPIADPASPQQHEGQRRSRSEGNAPTNADPASPQQHEGQRHARPEGNAPPSADPATPQQQEEQREAKSEGNAPPNADTPSPQQHEGQRQARSEGAEPGRRWTMRLSRTGRRLWRHARELAERLAGSRLSEAQVLELIAAETMAGPNACASPDGPVQTPTESPQPGEEAILAFLARHGCAEGFPWLAAAKRDSSGSSSMDSLLDGLADADAFELDRRLREIRCALQRLDFDLGVGLRALVDSRAYRDLGFATFRLYVTARLGICASKANSLLSLERRSGHGATALRGAYRDGAVTLMAAHTILPLMGGDHDSDWIARASAVTLRRLEDEVIWALTRIDIGPDRRCPAPPPADLDVRAETFASLRREEVERRAHAPAVEDPEGSTTEDAAPAPGSADDDKVQMRAQDASSTEGEESAAATSSEPSGDDHIQQHARDGGATGGQGDRPEVELAFWVPDSIAALAEEAMLAVRQGNEPRWRAFERMVALVILEWLSVPRHRDPVFERDGWRCSVPACTSRRHLHDHHRRFRSLGGGNEPANRTSVCAAHHLHGIHAGNIHARGTAPDGITWELGCRPGHEPLIRTLGDYNLSRIDQDAGSRDPGPRARDDGPRPRDPVPGPHDTDPGAHDGGPLLRDVDSGSRDLDPTSGDDALSPRDRQNPDRRYDSDSTSGDNVPAPSDHQTPEHRHAPDPTSPDDAPVPRHLDPITPSPHLA